MTILFKPSARSDLQAVRRWSHDRWDEKVAIDFLGGLADLIDRLKERPLIGRQRDALHEGLRSVRYKGYLVFHQVRGGGSVSIVAILHERRDLAAIDFADRISET